MSADGADRPEDQAQALARLTDGSMSARERIAALGRLAAVQGRRVARPAGLTDAVVQFAPGLAPRSLAQLQADHDGLVGRELARELIARAARASAAVGAAAGALASASEAAPVTLLSAPVLLGVESLAVVAVELRLVAELHTALGRPLPEDRMRRGALVLRSWTTGRGVSAADIAGGLGAGDLLARAARTQLSDRLLRRFLRSGLSFVPLLAGAAAAAALNRRATRRLGESVARDLLRGRERPGR